MNKRPGRARERRRAPGPSATGAAATPTATVAAGAAVTTSARITGGMTIVEREDTSATRKKVAGKEEATGAMKTGRGKVCEEYSSER